MWHNHLLFSLKSSFPFLVGNFVLDPLSEIALCLLTQVSLDPEHKFDLALELGKLEDARKILDDMPQEEYDTTDAQSKWKRLGDLALAK